MPLQTAVLPIPMAGGVDLRLNKRHVKPPKCLTLQNARFPNPGTIAKRFGGAALGNNYSAFSGTDRYTTVMTDAHGVFASGDELYCRDGEQLLRYNVATTTWVLHAIMPLTEVTISEPTVAPNQGTAFGDVVRTTDGLVAIVGDSVLSRVLVSIVDEVTGSRYVWSVSSANCSNARVVAVGTTIMVFFVNGTAPHSLFLKTFTRSTLATTDTNILSSPVTVITTNLKTYAGPNGLVRYDVQPYDGTKCLLAYVNNSSNIGYGFVSTAGAVTLAATETPTAFPDDIAIAVASGGNWALLWCTNGTNILRARIFDSSMTAVIAATTIETLSGAIKSLGAVWTSSTVVHAVWSLLTNLEVRHGSVTTSAVVTAAQLFYQARLVSQPWSYGGIAYCVMNNGNVGVVVRLGAPAGTGLSNPSSLQIGTVVAHFLPGEVATSPLGLNRLSHVTAGETANDFIFQIQTITESDDVQFANRYITLHFVTRADIGKISAHRVGGGTYLPGGLTWKIDGEGAHEEGFLVPYPDPVLAATTGGSMTASGTYSYRCYWEWISATGEIERSTAVAETITLSAIQNAVTVTVPTLPFTNRSDRLGLRGLGLGVYRANPGQTIHRRVSTLRVVTDSTPNGYLLNDQAQASLVFTDNMSDANAIDNEPDYLSSGEVDNIAPPSCSVACLGQGRMFLSGFSQDKDLIWYSKQRTFREAPLEFSDFNTIFVQDGEGPITALATLSDALYVFRRHQIYVVGGQATNNTGLNGGFLDARTVSDEVGCDNPASIVRGPQGLFFQSAKGIYLLNGMELSFVGADVVAITDECDITSAVVSEADCEIRFTVSPVPDGFTETIVFHYDVGAWSTWNCPSSQGGCMWQGSWVTVAAVNGLFQMTADQYYDEEVYSLDPAQRVSTAYSRVYESAWLRAGELVQGAQRFLRFLFAGQWKDGHKVQLKIAYDYNETWVDVKTWPPTVSSSTDNYQFELRPSRQIVQAIKIRVEDIADGVDALRDSFDLSELAAQLGIFAEPAQIADTKIAAT